MTDTIRDASHYLDQGSVQMMSEDEFQEWLADMDFMLKEWTASLPEHVSARLDYSIDSLDVLEAWLLERYPTTEAAMADTEAALFDGVARYLGETFRKNIGGQWEADPKGRLYDGFPHIHGFTDRLVLSPCPLWIATASIDRRRGDYFSSIFKISKAKVEAKDTE